MMNFHRILNRKVDGKNELFFILIIRPEFRSELYKNVLKDNRSSHIVIRILQEFFKTSVAIFFFDKKS